MIIKCDKCQTSFRLPDEKIKPEGTKVRCSKCKNIFTVYPLKQTTKAVEEAIEEKTRIGFMPTPFGDDKDEDGPITIKKQTEGISASIETLGHGISLSSVEIKKIDEPQQDLNEIMSSIEAGIKEQLSNQTDIMNNSLQNEVVSTPQTNLPPEKGKPENDLSPDIGSLLDSLSDIPSSPPVQKTSEIEHSPPEELPDLSTLLSTPEKPETKKELENQIAPLPDISEILSIPQSQQNNQIQPEPKPDEVKKEAQSTEKEKEIDNKLNIDIDKVFDSLFAESEQPKENVPTSQQEQQPRKTMLYMEAVPVAPQNTEQPQINKPANLPPSLTQEPIPTGVDNLDNLQIQDNLLSDDLSMFSSPAAPNQTASQPPTLSLGDDLLSEIPVPQNPLQPSIPEPTPPDKSSFDANSFSFGELGADLGIPSKTDEPGRFSPNANRSDDLLSQMDSIDNIAVPSQGELPSIPKPEVKKATKEEINISTVDKAKKISQDSPKSSAPLKPATIALKETKKDIKGEIIKWIFTLMFGGITIFTILTPSYIFPEINGGVKSILNDPFITDSISIENLYYKQLNKAETLLIFSGYITLKKPLPPDDITLIFNVSDLSGSDIIQIEYPLTYSEKYEDVMKISTMNEVKDFLKNNRIKIITQRKSQFIAPLIISNVDITRIDVKASIKINSQ